MFGLIWKEEEKLLWYKIRISFSSYPCLSAFQQRSLMCKDLKLQSQGCSLMSEQERCVAWVACWRHGLFNILVVFMS